LYDDLGAFEETVRLACREYKRKVLRCQRNSVAHGEPTVVLQLSAIRPAKFAYAHNAEEGCKEDGQEKQVVMCAGRLAYSSYVTNIFDVDWFDAVLR
jgi:hypothetical protein